MYRKKTTIIIVMCVAMVLMAVGYALLSTKLKIGGSTAVTSSWKVEFSAIRTTNLKGGATNKITPRVTATTATFSVDLVQPGDEATYEIDITNYGGVKAEIKGATYSVTGSEAIYVEIDGIRKGTTIDHCEGLETCPFITAIIKVGYNPAVEKDPTQKTKKIDITLDIGQYVEGNPTADGELVPELVVNDTLVQQILRDNSVQSDGAIDFSKSSVEDGTKGLYYTSNNTENNQVTYYFRGNVENNYVSFGKSEGYCDFGEEEEMWSGLHPSNGGKWTEETCTSSITFCDIYGSAILVAMDAETCINEYSETPITINATWKAESIIWRIVRINEDGSIRLVKETNTGSSMFNDNYDNADVGFMYGQTGANSYALTHANTNDSDIKDALDAWYTSNLSSYSSYLADAGFCNDRSVATSANTWESEDTALGYGINMTYYGTYGRFMNQGWNVKENLQPQFACPQTNDLFTLKGSNKGNKSLDNPIGLLTVDEVAYAGGKIYSSNEEYYLANGDYWWTMSPVSFDGYYPNVWRVHDVGIVSDFNGSSGVRPVINLKADVLFTLEGTGEAGTATNPYIVKTN